MSSNNKAPKPSFSGRLQKAPDSNRHPMEPAADTPTPAKPAPVEKPAEEPKAFTVRLSPSLIKRVRLACVERDVSQQDATAEALEEWLRKE